MPTPAAHVLVADDTTGIRLLLGKLLEREGFGVRLAADGQEALEAIQHARAPVDLLLSDVHMPRLDGLALCRALAPLRPDLPVLLMTAEPERARGVEQLSAVRGVVAKPFTLPCILHRVRLALQGREADLLSAC